MPLYNPNSATLRPELWHYSPRIRLPSDFSKIKNDFHKTKPRFSFLWLTTTTRTASSARASWPGWLMSVRGHSPATWPRAATSSTPWASAPTPGNCRHRLSDSSAKTTASTCPRSCRTKEPSAPPPSATSSSTPGRQNRNTSPAGTAQSRRNEWSFIIISG